MTYNGYYEDERGNRIIGCADGVQITFLGSNSLIQIGNSCKLEDTSIGMEDGAQCYIGDDIVCRGTRFYLHKNSLLKCGKGCFFSGGGGYT